MGKINIGRWLAGGVVAGVIMWVLEGVMSLLYVEQMQAALDAAGLSVEMNAAAVFTSILVSLLLGLLLIFLYAAVRPRFGPGPKTALIVAVALFAGGYLPSLLGYRMIGLYTDQLLLQWGIQGLVEMIVATLAGAWIYRES